MKRKLSETWLDRSGELDPGFGDNGMVVLSIPGFVRWNVYGLASHPHDDDSILVTGSCSRTGKDWNSAFVIKLRHDGSIDTGFGKNGLSTPAPDFNAEAIQPYVLQGGRLLVHISMRVNNAIVQALARLDANGVLDKSFGNQGVVTLNMMHYNMSHATVTLLDDGRIVVAGERQHAWNGKTEAIVIRLLENGQRDPALGRSTDGQLVLGGPMRGCTPGSVQCARAVGHTFIVAGRVGDTLFVRRYLDDGSADMSFGANGDFTIPIDVEPGHGAIGFIDDIVPTSDGACTIVGANMRAGEPYDLRGFIARIDSTGKLDPAFHGGKVQYIAATPSRLKTLRYGGDGCFVTSGSHGRSPASRILVGRCSASGLLTAPFGHLDDLATFDEPSGEYLHQGVAVQEPRGILVAGQRHGRDGTQAVLMRLLVSQHQG